MALRSGISVSTGAASAALAALVLAAGHVLMPGGAAAAAGAFAGLNGAWSGTGTVTLASGTRERLRCRVQYLVQNDDNNLQQSLRCASDSYRIEVNAYIDHRGGAISGHWNELTNEVSGNITGTFSDGVINASVRGTGFAATLDLIMQGLEQSVVIKPQEMDVTDVSIQLRKAGR